MTQRPKIPSEDVRKPYAPTPHEVSAIKAFVAKYEVPPPPRMIVTEKDGTTQVAIDHPDSDIASVLIMDALGTKDVHFLTGILHQLENATSGNTVNDRELNWMLAVIEGIKPRDQVEAMLAAQMAVVHIATMAFGGRLARSESIMQFEVAQRALCKLAQTFAAQVEVLQRYRCQGEQKVRIEDVQPNARVTTPAPEQPSKSNGQYHGHENGHAPRPTLRRANPHRKLVPGTGHAERPLPHARRHVAGGA